MISALLLVMAAAQPSMFDAPPPGFAAPARARPAAAPSSPRPRLQIDLSGLSDDDAIAAPARDTVEADDGSELPARRIDNGVASMISSIPIAPPAPQTRETRATSPRRPASARIEASSRVPAYAPAVW